MFGGGGGGGGRGAAGLPFGGGGGGPGGGATFVALGSVMIPVEVLASVVVALVLSRGGTGGFVFVGCGAGELDDVTTVTLGHSAPMPSPA